MFVNKNNQVRAGWIIAAAFLIVLVGQFVFMLPGTTLLSILELSYQDTFTYTPWFFILTQGLATVGGIFATLVAWRAINKHYPLSLGLRGRVKDLFIGLLFGAVSMTLVFIILLVTD